MSYGDLHKQQLDWHESLSYHDDDWVWQELGLWGGHCWVNWGVDKGKLHKVLLEDHHEDDKGKDRRVAERVVSFDYLLHESLVDDQSVHEDEGAANLQDI